MSLKQIPLELQADALEALHALEEFATAQADASERFRTDPREGAAAAVDAANALMRRVQQSGGAHPKARLALTSLSSALDDLKRGQCPDWLKPVRYGNRPPLSDAEQARNFHIALAVGLLIDREGSIERACRRVAAALSLTWKEVKDRYKRVTRSGTATRAAYDDRRAQHADDDPEEVAETILSVLKQSELNH